MITRARQGTDGMTPWQRQFGQPWRRSLPLFGEKVMYRPLGKHATRLTEKFLPGVFAGLPDRGGDLVLLTPDGAVRARTLRRLPPGEQYDQELLATVRGTPWEPVPGQNVSAIPISIRADPVTEDLPEREHESVPTARRLYIRKDVEIAKYGYTPGCHGCRNLREDRPHVGHSEACRQRIEKAVMEGDAAGRQRLTESLLRRAPADRPAAAAEPAAATEASSAPPAPSGSQGASASPHQPGVPAGPALQRSSDERPRPSKEPPARRARTEEPEAAPAAAEASASSSAGPSRVRPRESEDAPTREAKRVMLALAANLSAVRGGTAAQATEAVNETFGYKCFNSFANEFNLWKDTALDLRSGFDFSLAKDREYVRGLAAQLRPEVVLGSPLRREGALEMHRLQHLEFLGDLYKKAVENEGHFVHQHPRASDLWSSSALQQLRQATGTQTFEGDLCAVAACAYDEDGLALVADPSRWITSLMGLDTEIGHACANESATAEQHHRHRKPSSCKGGGTYGGGVSTTALCERGAQRSAADQAASGQACLD